MRVSRREFLSGAAAFAALPGGFLFAAPSGWKPGGKADLVFGVLADTHLRTAWDGKSVDKNYTDKYFLAALNYFKKQNVDAVMHLGDMANNGQVEAMQFHADAWRKVFPRDIGMDGRKVERLFVTGNHDVEGFTYTNFIERLIKNPAEREKHLLVTDMAANWERIWGEPYEEAWHKVVNGYHFFAQHYPNGDFDAQKTATIVKACRDKVTLDDGNRPMFLLAHRRPHLSAMDRAVRPLANTFGFHGHWHNTAADWNVIGLDKGRNFPHVQCPACHSSRGEAFPVTDENDSKPSIQGGDWKNWQSRQGLLVRVFDDMLVIERHEFDNGVASLGPDWIMPLGKHKLHPFSKDELKKVIGVPQFPAKAKLVVNTGMVSVAAEDAANADANRKGKAKKVPGIKVSIPLANGNPDSRVYSYDVEVTGDDPDNKLCKAVYAAGCNMGIDREPNHGVTTLEIPKSELPPGKTFTIAVRPLTSLGTVGKAVCYNSHCKGDAR